MKKLPTTRMVTLQCRDGEVQIHIIYNKPSMQLKADQPKRFIVNTAIEEAVSVLTDLYLPFIACSPNDNCENSMHDVEQKYPAQPQVVLESEFSNDTFTIESDKRDVPILNCIRDVTPSVELSEDRFEDDPESHSPKMASNMDIMQNISFRAFSDVGRDSDFEICTESENRRILDRRTFETGCHEDSLKSPAALCKFNDVRSEKLSYSTEARNNVLDIDKDLVDNAYSEDPSVKTNGSIVKTDFLHLGNFLDFEDLRNAMEDNSNDFCGSVPLEVSPAGTDSSVPDGVAITSGTKNTDFASCFAAWLQKRTEYSGPLSDSSQLVNSADVDIETVSNSKTRTLKKVPKGIGSGVNLKQRLTCSQCNDQYNSKEELSLHLLVHKYQHEYGSVDKNVSEARTKNYQSIPVFYQKRKKSHFSGVNRKNTKIRFGRKVLHKENHNLLPKDGDLSKTYHLSRHENQIVTQKQFSSIKASKNVSDNTNTLTEKGDAQKSSCDSTQVTKDVVDNCNTKQNEGLVSSTYSCENCQRLFADGRKLLHHRRVHMRRYTFTCTYCGKVEYQRRVLRLHLMQHVKKGELPFDALKDGRTYILRSASYTCDMCCKTVQNKDEFNKHLKTHSPVELNLCYSGGGKVQIAQDVDGKRCGVPMKTSMKKAIENEASVVISDKAHSLGDSAKLPSSDCSVPFAHVTNYARTADVLHQKIKPCSVRLVKCELITDTWSYECIKDLINGTHKTNLISGGITSNIVPPDAITTAKEQFCHTRNVNIDWKCDDFFVNDSRDDIEFHSRNRKNIQTLKSEGPCSKSDEASSNFDKTPQLPVTLGSQITMRENDGMW